MEPMDVVAAWDAALRAGDWSSAEACLADDAVYVSLGEGDDEARTCAGARAIVDLMRSWKGKLPDVEVDRWRTFGPDVLADLRQPAWDGAIWFQVLTVEGDRIVRLEDFGEEACALAAVASA